MDYVASAIDTGSAYLSERLGTDSRFLGEKRNDSYAARPTLRSRALSCVCVEKGSEVFAHRLAETVQQAKESGWLTPNEEEMKVNPLVKGTIYYGSRMSPIAVTGSSRDAHARFGSCSWSRSMGSRRLTINCVGGISLRSGGERPRLRRRGPGQARGQGRGQGSPVGAHC